MTKSPLNPFLVSLGLVYNYFSLDKFGKNESVGTSFEEIWDVSSDKSFLTTASTMRIRAGDSEDTEGGDGASQVTIFGLNENYDLDSESITLLGNTQSATTTKTFLHIHRMKVTSMSTTATARTNVGVITLEATSDSTPQAQIGADLGQTTMSHFIVPRDCTLFFTRIYANIARGDDAIVTLEVMPENEGWQTKRFLRVYQSHVAINLNGELTAPGKSRIVMRARAGQGNIAVACGYDGIYVHNDEITLNDDLG